jgi:transposase
MRRETLVCVGIDQGESRFQVCVLVEGALKEQRAFAHDGSGIAEAIAWLRSQVEGEASRLRVAIETPRGAIVEGLLQAGIAVLSLNPKQLDRFRDRFTVAGSKDDRLDARVLADSLRTDETAFRPLRLDPERLTRLREASRLEDEIKQELRRLSNRLRSLLQRYHVELLALHPSADEPWFWSLIEIAATPQAGAWLRKKRIEPLLRQYRIRRLKPEEVITRLRKTPLPAAPGVVQACSEHALMLVPRLQLRARQLALCQDRIERLLNQLQGGDEPDTTEHRDVRILRSLPGVGRCTVATMLAEAWEPLAARDFNVLRAQSGSAPITKQSGRTRLVSMRRACNPRLRGAVYQWAFTAIRIDPRAKVRYQALRAKGHSHPRALRGVGDRLLKMLVSMLQTGHTYDPARRLVA